MASEEDGPLAKTALNLQAGAWLRKVREDRKWSAAKFAKSVGQILKIKVTDGALYAWETGKNTVPAAVMLAASEITAQPVAMDGGARKRLLDELLDELDRRREERQGE